MRVGVAMLDLHSMGVHLSNLDYQVFNDLRNQYARGVDYRWERWFNRIHRRNEYHLVTVRHKPRDEGRLLPHEEKALNIRSLEDRRAEWQSTVDYVRSELAQDGALYLRDGSVIRNAYKIADALSNARWFVTHAHVRAAKAGR